MYRLKESSNFISLSKIKFKTMLKTKILLIACILMTFTLEAQDCQEDFLITRVEGQGVGHHFLKLSDQERNRLIKTQLGSMTSYNGPVNYCAEGAPFEIEVLTPKNPPEGEFLVIFEEVDPTEFLLKYKIYLNESIIAEEAIPTSLFNSHDTFYGKTVSEYGIKLLVNSADDPGDFEDDETNGAIGQQITFADGNNWLTILGDKTQLGSNEFDIIDTEYGDVFFNIDPYQAFSNFGPANFAPFSLCRYSYDQFSPYLGPGWWHSANEIATKKNTIDKLNNVDIVLTADKTLWSRCIVVESSNQHYEDLGISANGNKENFEIRNDPSVGRFDSDGNGLADADGTGTGMSWFPGYALDVETGQRLNIFFSENSSYGDADPFDDTRCNNSDDMMWNPSADLSLGLGGIGGIYDAYVGGQHYIYVSRTPYDECTFLREKLSNNNYLRKIEGMETISWAGVPVLSEGAAFTSYEDGLIPSETLIEIRVENKVQNRVTSNKYEGMSSFTFSLDDDVSPANHYNKIKFKAYPNPTRSFLNIKMDEEIASSPFTIQMLDLQGRLVLEDKNVTAIDINHLAKGSYVMRLITDKAIGLEKIMIMND